MRSLDRKRVAVVKTSTARSPPTGIFIAIFRERTIYLTIYFIGEKELLEIVSVRGAAVEIVRNIVKFTRGESRNRVDVEKARRYISFHFDLT